MKILSNEGRVVAINKSGKWEPINGCSEYDISKAIHDGYIEDYEVQEELQSEDIVDFALTLAVCITALFVGMALFNLAP